MVVAMPQLYYIWVACVHVDKPHDSIAIQQQYCKWGVACEAHVNSIQLAVIKNQFILL